MEKSKTSNGDLTLIWKQGFSQAKETEEGDNGRIEEAIDPLRTVNIETSQVEYEGRQNTNASSSWI